MLCWANRLSPNMTQTPYLVQSPLISSRQHPHSSLVLPFPSLHSQIPQGSPCPLPLHGTVNYFPLPSADCASVCLAQIISSFAFKFTYILTCIWSFFENLLFFFPSTPLITINHYLDVQWSLKIPVFHSCSVPTDLDSLFPWYVILNLHKFILMAFKTDLI